MVGVSAWWSVCRDLVDGDAGAGVVDDGFALGIGGDEGLNGEVVDGAGQAAAGVVDQVDRIVDVEGVAAAGEFDVVVDVAAGFVAGHGFHDVAHGDALVERGEHPEFDHAAEGGLADEQAGHG